MLKKSITFTNYDGETETGTYYFHLSKAELVKLEMSLDGGIRGHMQRLIDAKDGETIMKEIDRFIMMAYGVRTTDGKGFVKNDLVREQFKSSEAYSELFIELCTDASKVAHFINGMVPNDLKQDIEELQANIERAAQTGEIPTHNESMAERTHPSDPAAQPAPSSDWQTYGGPEKPESSTAQEPRVLTEVEMREMDAEDLKAGLANGVYKLQ